MTSFYLFVKRRAVALIELIRNPPPQLQMTWPRLPAPAVPDLPDGFVLRTYLDSDESAYRELVEEIFGHKFELGYWLDRTVTDGFFIVEHIASGKIAATCMATRCQDGQYPGGGNLGWMATGPEFRGNGLGRIISAAVTRRLVEEGFSDIFLETDDWRLPAISIYLKLGWTPKKFSPAMASRWEHVERQISNSRSKSGGLA